MSIHLLPTSLYLFSALKRTKAYSVLEDVRPTLRNKPSGLKTDWYDTVSKSSAPRWQASNICTPSSSSTSMGSPATPQSPSQEFEHISSLLAVSPPPIFSKSSSSPSFHGKIVPLIDEKSMGSHTRSVVVCISSLLPHTALNPLLQPFSLPRAYKDDQGQRQQPGLRKLPQWLRDDFRNLYIRRIIEQVCVSDTPWSNPRLESLQRELNHVYPTHRIRLHSDDAAVVLV